MEASKSRPFHQAAENTGIPTTIRCASRLRPFSNVTSATSSLSALADAISANPVVKSFGAEDREARRFEAHIDRWRIAQTKTWMRGNDIGFGQNVLLVGLQAGLTGSGFFAVALLANQLALRLAREADAGGVTINVVSLEEGRAALDELLARLLRPATGT